MAQFQIADLYEQNQKLLQQVSELERYKEKYLEFAEKALGRFSLDKSDSHLFARSWSVLMQSITGGGWAPDGGHSTEVAVKGGSAQARTAPAPDWVSTSVGLLLKVDG